MAAMGHDKKGKAGAVRVVALHGPGLPVLTVAAPEVIDAGWAAVGA
jgi:hypothetical protein